MRSPTSHKGENGKILVIGGSEEYVGAPALAAMAALRAGADLSVVAAPERAAYAINAWSPDLITKKLRGRWLAERHVSGLAKMAAGFDCAIIGPGLGERKETLAAVRKLCEKIEIPKIIDADAIKAKPVLENCIVTPHAREFELLFGERGTRASVKSHARENAIVLLKGHVDIISDGRRVAENRTGNAGMTVGGSGDVLAGLCGGLVAQHIPLFEAAKRAARANGLAGDLLKREMGYGFVASDLLGAVPRVMR